MKLLYERADLLKNKIMEINKNIEIYETFPRAVEKILKLKYQYFSEVFKYKDIYDGYLSYLAGLFFKSNKYEKFGNLILPKI